jgi:hypothetical protein
VEKFKETSNVINKAIAITDEFSELLSSYKPIKGKQLILNKRN